MKALHASDIRYHGNLTSSNCLVDRMWCCRVADYGLRQLRADEKKFLENYSTSDYKGNRDFNLKDSLDQFTNLRVITFDTFNNQVSIIESRSTPASLWSKGMVTMVTIQDGARNSLKLNLKKIFKSILFFHWSTFMGGSWTPIGKKTRFIGRITSGWCVQLRDNTKRDIHSKWTLCSTAHVQICSW
jgi:hypothetical protein